MLMTLAGCKKQEQAVIEKPVPPPVEKPVPPVSIRVEAQVFRLPRSLAAAQVLSQPKNADFTAVFQRVQELVAEKKAVLIASPSIGTRSGHKAVAESILEHRYPTEFSPPQIPQQIGVGGTQKTTTTKTTTTIESVETNAAFPQSPATPTAFEKRDLGITIECEPTYEREFDVIDVSVVIHFSVLQRTIKYSGDNGAVIEQPLFYNNRISSNVSIKNGGVAFLGTVEPDKTLNKGDDMTDVIFIHAATW